MSADESEYEGDRKKHPAEFIVVHPKWQGKDLRRFNKEIDRLYRLVWGSGFLHTRGNPPRTRLDIERISLKDTDPPKGLPENFYDSEWLESLLPVEKEALHILEGVQWDFTIPAGVETGTITEEFAANVAKLKLRLRECLPDSDADSDES